MHGTAASSRCSYCDAGIPVARPHFAEPHGMLHIISHNAAHTLLQGVLCGNYDSECRHITEPFGLYEFAWWPRWCRNGKLRWLISVEHHDDGTYTLGNRAH